jgi:hypothetical protein
LGIRKFKAEAIASQITSQINMFICCASYEIRCRTLASYIDSTSVQVALIGSYVEVASLVSDSKKYLYERFGDRSVPLEFSARYPLTTANNLDAALKKSSITNRICLVDISTFTHESLLILFKLLIIHKKSNDKIFIVYTNAAEYNPGVPDENKWLSYGVREVRTVLGYPGEVVPSKQSHLIILVGYEHERASELIRAFEPDLLSLGHGKSGTQTAVQHHQTNQHFFGLVRQAVATHPGVNTFEFSCNDPIATKVAILEQIALYPECNHIIAPMNTKLSTIGSGLVSSEDSKIQICYAEPLQYNYRNYSSPGEDCYLIEFDDLLASLKKGI